MELATLPWANVNAIQDSLEMNANSANAPTPVNLDPATTLPENVPAMLDTEEIDVMNKNHYAPTIAVIMEPVNNIEAIIIVNVTKGSWELTVLKKLALGPIIVAEMDFAALITKNAIVTVDLPELIALHRNP